MNDLESILAFAVLMLIGVPLIALNVYIRNQKREEEK